jgi:hypothetical protein
MKKNVTVGTEVRSDASKVVSDTVWTAGTLSAPSSSVTTRVGVLNARSMPPDRVRAVMASGASSS